MTDPTPKTRVVLVDDHNVVRAGLKSFLESFPDIAIVGLAPSGEALLESVEIWLPDVIVMDVLMPGGIDGIETTKRVKAIAPTTQVVILTAYSDNERVIAGLRAGAISYVRKNADPTVLLGAIRGAATGQSILDPAVASMLMQEFVQIETPATDDQLTEREREVLTLIANGKTNKEIAEKLVISAETVKSHVGNILTKFQLAHRTQAIVYALKQGILTLNDINLEEKDEG